ncbi:hypothetical protein MTO96_023574 [Rhipicephalus appendiculatus]
MAQDPVWDDFLEEVSRMDFYIEDKHPLRVAQEVVEDGSIEHNGCRLPLPLHCSENGKRVCHLLRLLPSLNDLLYVIGVKVTEVAPGRIAVHGHIVISVEFCKRRGSLLLEAVMFLYCIVAKHRCVDTLEVSGQKYDFVEKVLQALTSNASVLHLTFDLSFAGRRESFKRMLFQPSGSNDPDPQESDKQMIRYHAQHLAAGLGKTKSLRRLDLSNNFSIAEIRCIAEAAHQAESLEELHFLDIGAEVVEPISALHQDMATKWKVTFGRLTMFRYFNWAEEFARFHELLSNPDSSDTVNLLFAPVGHACGPPGISCGDHLTCLHLFGDMTDEGTARSLGLYLQLTRSLRQLRMELRTSRESARAILNGITMNGSIEQLFIGGFSVCVDWAILTNWLTENRRLHSLQAQRNYGLVQCAAAFALGSWHKRAAIAYEQVSWHPQLPETIQCVESVSKEEAMGKIHQANVRLRNEFWKLSGIVKEELVCNQLPTVVDVAGCVLQIDKAGLLPVAAHTLIPQDR